MIQKTKEFLYPLKIRYLDHGQILKNVFQKVLYLTGTVKRLVSFGAFVEVFPGIEGLVHISQISHKHINTPHEVLKDGQEVEVKVLDVNANEKRLSLSIKDLLENPEKEEEFEYELPEETTGFSFSEVIGDQLKGFTNK